MPSTTLYDFNASTGFTYDAAKTEFTGAVMRLKNSIGAGNDTVTAPVVAGALASPWQPALTVVEPVGYWHKFLVSFDGGTTWETYGPAGWRRVYAQSDVVDYGIPSGAFARIREWPDWDAAMFRLTIYMERETGGGDGSIGNLDMTYGAAVYAVTGEPDGADVLDPPGTPDANNFDYGLMPDFPYTQEFMDGAVEYPLEGGYGQTLKTCTGLRSIFKDLRWSARTSAELTTLLAFLRAHRDEAFEWTPVGEVAARKFIATDPRVIGAGVRPREVRASFVEVLP